MKDQDVKKPIERGIGDSPYIVYIEADDNAVRAMRDYLDWYWGAQLASGADGLVIDRDALRAVTA